MANLRYYNNSGPFWDFIASLENKDFSNHPFLSAWAGESNEEAAGPSTARQQAATAAANDDTDRKSTTDRDTPMDDPEEVAPEEWSPWGPRGWGFGPRGFGGRGRGGHGRGGFNRAPPHGGSWPHHGPPPPPPAGEQPPAAPANGEFPPPPPGGEEGFQGPPPPWAQEHGPRHHHHGGPGPHRFGRGGRGGRCGGRGGQGWAKGGMPFDMSKLGEFIQSQIFGATEGNNNERSADAAAHGDYTPPVDIFDTEVAYVIHVSLPGAKKEDIAVNWDAERSELNITGVLYRPGDEEFLKTLALDERKVGAFSRKVRLGSRVNPAQVDAEGISAKLEEGILRVHVPKEDKEFDVIHKIDIE